MNRKIVADSSANLPAFAGIPYTSVPLKILAGDREFVDDLSLDTGEMLEVLERHPGKSSTACPSVGDWLEAFGDGEEVFAVAITSNLSGSYNAAVQAKAIYEEQHPGRHVCCLDTLSTGPEMILLVEKLKELTEAGLSFEETETRIREYMTKTHLLFLLESVDNLAKNGRVSPLIAKAVGFLNIRIICKASDGGTLQQLHKVRGEKKGLDVLFSEMKAHGFTGGKVRINHAHNLEAAEALLARIRREYPNVQATVTPMTGLCCYYAERGSVMIGFEG